MNKYLSKKSKKNIFTLFYFKKLTFFLQLFDSFFAPLQLQQKYHDLEQKYKTDTQNLEKKYAESRKHSAVDMAILQAKGKNTKAIKALLDMDKISLKEDGTLEGLDLEGLKNTDRYLFDIEQTHIEGANGGQKGNHMFQNNEDTLLKIARNAAGLK